MMCRVFLGILCSCCASQVASAQNLLLQDSLKIISPNGREKFLTGSDTVITWTDIPRTDTVKLEYSTDAGSSWNLITDTASIGRYPWHIPKSASDSCLVRIAPLSNVYLSEWSRGINADTSNFAVGYKVAVDKYMNVYVTGWFGGTVDFGGITLTSNFGENIFVAKFQPDGTISWAKQAGGKGGLDEGYGIATDNSGNIYVVGSFSDTADFSGDTLVSFGGFDICLIKYHSDGSIEWVKQIGDTANNFPSGMCIDKFGSIYISGVGVSKYLPDGSQQWVNTNINGSNIAVDTEGNYYLSNTGSNAGISKYLSDGSLVWSTPITGASFLEIHGMAVNKSEEVYYTGGFGDSVNFGGLTLKGNGVFAAKHNRDGTPSWVKNIGDPWSYGIAVDNNGSCIVSGNFQGNIIILDKDGNNIWSGTGRNKNVDMGYGVAFDNLGGFCVTGFYANTAIIEKDTLYNTSGGWPHLFIWDVPGNPPLPDTSDAFFSIIKPKALICIPNDSDYPGDLKNIPIVLKNLQPPSLQSFKMNFRAQVLYDPSVLSPKTGMVMHGPKYDTITVSGSLGSDSVLARIPFIPSLSDTTFSPMNIVDFEWLDATGNPVDYDAETESGTFHLLFGCGDSLLRNFMITGKMDEITSITPNPAHDNVHIGIQLAEPGRTQLLVVNLLGIRVATISDGDLKSGAHLFDFNAKDLTEGPYFLLMQTPSVRRLERFDIKK